MVSDASRMIIKSKVKLQKENPFFSYLVMNLKFVEVEKDSEEVETMAVDSRGKCYYNPKFVMTLAENEVKAVLSHEVLHLALEHLIRKGERDHELFNIATDLGINYLLVKNGFEFGTELTKFALIPHGTTYDFDNGVVVKDLDKKTAEMIYAELEKNPKFKKKPQKQNGGSNGQGKGKDGYGQKRFDKHIYSKGSGRTQEARDNAKKWKRVFTEATVYAKQQGNLPDGMERMVDMILDEKVNWKYLLYKYITRTLPYDYTYSRQSKRSISSGFFMPSILKEDINIVVSVDTSGSISQKELSEFLGEIVGISKNFQSINLTLIVCDCEIHEVYQMRKGDIQNIQDLKIGGGGGTSHIPVYEYIKENLPNTRFVINFTDGYTSFPEEEEIKSIWVLTENSCKDENIPFGEIIRIE